MFPLKLKSWPERWIALLKTVSILLVSVAGACVAPVGLKPDVVLSEAQRLKEISGTWEDAEDPGHRLVLEGHLWTTLSHGQVQSISPVLSWKGSQVVLCEGGWRQKREIHLDAAGSLVVRDHRASRIHRFKRSVAGVPAGHSASPALPAPMALDPARIAEIQHQLWRRGGPPPAAEGEVVKPGSEAVLPWAQSETGVGDFSVADLGRMADWAQTVDYLKSLIAEVGWIDVERFGYAASNAAFSIAHHSSDLSLMRAALPGVERDALAGRTEGEDYALLFDRVQLRSGKKQRYGTQIGFDSANRALVLPLEDRDRVDAWRESLDMMPLAEYVRTVARFNKAFAPEELVIAGDCADP